MLQGQIVLLDTYQMRSLVKWVCLHLTIAVSHPNWIF